MDYASDFDFEDDFDEVFNICPETKLLNYLVWVSRLLKCQKNWEVDALCLDMERIDLDQEDTESNLNENSIILESKDVANILLSDNAMKKNLEICVLVLLEFVKNKIENFEKNDYTELLNFITGICGFVEACEVNKIIIMPLKLQVTDFLSDLFSILDNAHGYNFIKRAPVYQPITTIIGNFKKIQFARSYILLQISKKLKPLYNQIKVNTANRTGMGMYEVLLLYLVVLKQILEFDMQKFFFLNVTNVLKKETKVLMVINQELSNMIGNVPDYVACSVQTCLNLLS